MSVLFISTPTLSLRDILMAEKEYFIDDRVVIPEEIKKMSIEELEAAIKKLEQELRDKKKTA